jgi:hypothetical protein
LRCFIRWAAPEVEKNYHNRGVGRPACAYAALTH